jgi:hypothetical protein
MSKMVVSDACLKRITSFLASDPRFDHTRRALAEGGIDLDGSSASLTAFATWLLLINEREYVTAYATHNEKMSGRTVWMKYDDGFIAWSMSDLEAFKAMQSWLYQLDLEEPQDWVIPVIDRAARDLAEMIIVALPGYDELPWG